MERRRSIFDSISETKVFHSLETRWSKAGYILYPELPLTKIVHIEREELAPKEWEFFLKTNVDYTLCERKGCPLLSIEFDGMGKGFSKCEKYIPNLETSDPYRKLKLNFKLKVAKKVHYPLIIVSYEETVPLDVGDSFMILDCIIGQILAKLKVPDIINNLVKEFKEEHEGLNYIEQQEYIEGLVLAAEIQSEVESDPIVARVAEYLELVPFKRIQYTYLDDPPLIGSRVTVETPGIPIVKSVWVRNFEGWVWPRDVAQNIAEYLALKRAFLLSKKNSGG